MLGICGPAGRHCRLPEKGGRRAGHRCRALHQRRQFISQALVRWAYDQQVTLDFSRPGKLTDNASIEPFNGRFRYECLNGHWFLSLPNAQEKIDRWRQDHNGFRPYSSLQNLTPDEVAAATATVELQNA